MDKNISNNLMNEAAKSLLVQKNQLDSVENYLVNLHEGLQELNDIQEKNLKDINQLLNQAEMMCKDFGIDISDIDFNDELIPINLEEFVGETDNEFQELHTIKFKPQTLETVEIKNDITWDDYMENIEFYAEKHSLILDRDPFDLLLSESEKKELSKKVLEDYTAKKANCDKYDYMIAAFCGVVSGIIDSFFVGMPEESKLGEWTKEQTDKFVIRIAKINGWKPKSDSTDNIVNAINFFEGKYGVNYDQAKSADVDNKVKNMSMNNHHIKSLGHAPDLIGLIFSIIDQFTSTSHFLDNGKIITFNTKEYKLEGNNFISKLFCGFSNWLGHLISDCAGSSTSRRENPNGYGSGIPMPLFELFQLCGKGNFKIYKNDNSVESVSLADLSVKVFESGYDARFGVAQAIPVVINDLMIRLLWSIKNRFYSQKDWNECIPIGNKPELRRMLLTGHGVLCLVDGVDARIRSGGKALDFAKHLNFVAWKRLAFSGLVEVRALYKENTIDIVAMNSDLEKEWNRLYSAI